MENPNLFFFQNFTEILTEYSSLKQSKLLKTLNKNTSLSIRQKFLTDEAQGNPTKK